MKYIVLIFCLLETSESLRACYHYTQEFAEKDINTIPQCKDQKNKECQNIKQEIKEFFDAVKAGTGWFSGNYANQQFFKEIADKTLKMESEKEPRLPSEYSETVKTRKKYINLIFSKNHYRELLVTDYLHRKQNIKDNTSFKDYLSQAIHKDSSILEHKVYIKEK